MTAWLKRVMVLGGSVLTALPALAQDAEPASAAVGGLTATALLGTRIYSILGLIILLAGFKVFDVFTPYKLHKELAEDQNVAIGVMVAGLFIALAIVIASAIV